MLAPLGFLGDSLTVGTITNGFLAMVNALGTYDGTLTSNDGTRAIVDGTLFRLDGLVGRSINQDTSPWPYPGSLDVLNAWRTAGWHPAYYVVALASNDFDQNLAGLKVRINNLLDLITAERVGRILWVGPVVGPGSTYTDAQIATIYQALNEVAAARSTANITVYDISSAIHNGRDESGLWLAAADKRHMTPAGYTLRGQLIAAQMAILFATPASSSTTVTVSPPPVATNTVRVSVSPPPVSTATTTVTVLPPPVVAHGTATVTVAPRVIATGTTTVTVVAAPPAFGVYHRVNGAWTADNDVTVYRRIAGNWVEISPS